MTDHDTEEEDASIHGSDDESEGEIRMAISKRVKHVSQSKSVLEDDDDVTDALEGNELQSKAPVRERKRSTNKNKATDVSQPALTKWRICAPKLALKMTYTVEGVLETWNDTTEYGISFRAMTVEEQQSEVKVLNKGAAKGMKGIMKTKLLAVHYKKVLADKLREHLSGSRVAPASMFHCAPKTYNVELVNLSFISVGEWVEVDSDRTPGFNSEGGILVAVVISVHDDFADVK
jgi:hypothetical protein